MALGMLYMSSDEVKDKLLQSYEILGFQIPSISDFDMNEVKDAITHDKKANDKGCSVVFVSEIGNGSIEEWSMEKLLNRLECN